MATYEEDLDEDEDLDDEEEEAEEEEDCPDCGRSDCDGALGEACEEDDEDEELCNICDESTCPGATGQRCQHLHAWREGRRASINNKLITSNPYSNGNKGPSFLASSWLDGWHDQYKPD